MGEHQVSAGSGFVHLNVVVNDGVVCPVDEHEGTDGCLHEVVQVLRMLLLVLVGTRVENDRR